MSKLAKFTDSNKRECGPKTEEHKLNLAISLNKACAQKRKITDDIIDKIFELRNKGDTFESIAKQVGLSRAYVSEIYNGCILKMTELNDEAIKNKLNNLKEQKHKKESIPIEHRSAIGKRKLSFDQMIKMIKYKYDNPTITYVEIVKNAQDLLGFAITMDQCKNLVSGKTKLYEFEFTDKDISYNDYLNMINK